MQSTYYQKGTAMLISITNTWNENSALKAQ